MTRLLLFVDWLLGLYVFILIMTAIASWLVAFDVINTRNDIARKIVYALDAISRWAGPLLHHTVHPDPVDPLGRYPRSGRHVKPGIVSVISPAQVNAAMLRGFLGRFRIDRSARRAPVGLLPDHNQRPILGFPHIGNDIG
jgi:hypothetical protein